MARDPLFWVLVRNYRLLETNSLVQSPNVDLRAHKPPVIVREINGEYMEGSRVIDSIKSLGNDANIKHYRHAAHGVVVSHEYANDFPVWVCLERNEHCPPNHLTVLNLFDFKFLMVPISTICWVSSHEAANRDLYTIIGGPGKHGYREVRLPRIVQKLGLPQQAKYAFLLSSVPLTKLESSRQQALFDQQYANIKRIYAARSLRNPDPFGNTPQQPSQPITRNLLEYYRHHHLFNDEENYRHVVQNRITELQRQVPEGYCRCSCSYPGLEPTYVNRNPLHRHITDADCRSGSNHRLHCVFAAYRLGPCVINPSTTQHDHFVVSEEDDSMNAASVAISPSEYTVETQNGADTENVFNSLPHELEALVGQSPFNDSERVLQDIHTWATIHDMPLSPPLESRPVSPIIDIFSEVPPDLDRTDNLPDLVDIAAIQRNYPALMTTPEPPEMRR